MKTYKSAGVDLDLLVKLKGFMLNNYEVLLKGHYSPVVPIDRENYVSLHTDGVGTKMLVAEYLQKFDTVGIDAVAMNVNDMACINCKPMIGVDYIAAKKNDAETIQKIFEGVLRGCKLANVALVGGETAILPELVNGYDLSFSCMGMGKISEVVDGSRIKEGDLIIGIESNGLHSNGFSLARKVLDLEEFGKEMLKPTLIYSNTALELCKEIEVKGMAHITGGGFTKLRRLGTNFDYLLENMPKPGKIFQLLAEYISNEKELYRIFNMGIGFIIIVNEENKEKCMRLVAKNGLKPHIIGKTVKGTGRVIIRTDKEIVI